MLSYKISKNEPLGFDEIQTSELYLSHDLSFISGVTLQRYGLIDKQQIKIEYNSDGLFHNAIINIENVTRQGFVVIPQSYPILSYKDGEIEYFYIEFVDGKFYIFEEDNNKLTCDIQGKQASIQKTDKKVILPTKYWIENNQFQLGDIIYDVSFELDLNGDVVTESLPIKLTIFNGTTVIANIWNKSQWQKISKFIINKESDYALDVDAVSMAQNFKYINYKISVDEDIMSPSTMNNFTYKKKYVETLNHSITDKNGHDIEIGSQVINIGDGQNPIYIDVSDDLLNVTIDNVTYPIEEEWRNVKSNGNRLHIFINDVNKFNLVQGQKIFVKSKENDTVYCPVIAEDKEEYISYCGQNYFLSEDTIDCISIGDVEYALTYYNKEDNKYAYITVDDELRVFNVTDNGKTLEQVITTSQFQKTFGDEETQKLPTYDIVKHQYVTIRNEKFLVRELTSIDKDDKEYIEKGVTIDMPVTYELILEELISNNVLRCFNSSNSQGFDEIYPIIANNYDNFNYELYNELINESNVEFSSYISTYSDSLFDDIRLYNPLTFIQIPTLFTNDMALNVRQEDILENDFYANEIAKSINPIVDMEKEIYYPCSYNDDGATFDDATELVFDLHFRTRDLNTWKINGDDQLYNQWNITDYYPSTVDEGALFDTPSDLLTFLNFTNDDVFYQKSKIGKSFLRLLFFDSNDPQNQTLLCSNTIWVDEGKLYQTYVNNLSKKNEKYNIFDEKEYETLSEKSINHDWFNNTDDTKTVNSIGVNTEPFLNGSNDVKRLIDSDKRLGARISVKNRYESSESSEGYYLHIFKDYCDGLYERDIYMKVEFNHAGVGRTLNFTLPPKDEEELKGIKLDDLYKHLYIPLKAKYSKENQKYYYYYANNDWYKKINESNRLIFSLFELKIKDDSETPLT